MTFSRRTFILAVVVLIGWVSILITGISSDVYLGDEVVHYRVVKMMYETHSRPIVDPMVNSNERVERRIVTDILWHTLIAVVWIIIGKVSIVVAQIYQSLWYILLVIITYIFASRFFGKAVGLLSGVIIATMPMYGAYSTMLYLDICVAATTLLVFYFLFKGNYVFAGIILAIDFLAKRNSYFIVPFCCLYIIFFTSGNLKRHILNLILFFIPIVLLHTPELWFRLKKIGSVFNHPAIANFAIVQFMEKQRFIKVVFIHPEDWFYDPTIIVKYLGIVFFAGLVLYFFGIRRNKMILFEKMLWLIAGTYFILYLYLFKKMWAVRYMSPIVPPLAILSAIGISRYIAERRKMFILGIIIIVGFMQFFMALAYVYTQRKIPKEIWDSYEFIKQSTPMSSRFMSTPDVAVYTDRKSSWSGDVSLSEQPYLFWRADDAEAKEILEYNGIDYIYVDKNRIRDDSNGLHDIKFYPLSFIKKLPHFSFLNLVFKNERVSIWEVVE